MPDEGLVEAAAQALAVARLLAVGEVNRAAGEVRRAYLTEIPAQQMIYAAKEEEARRWVAETAAGTADLSSYAWLPGEVGLTAETPDQLAQVWLAMAALWRLAGPAIEAARLAAGAAVLAAGTVEEVAAAVEAGQAALAQLRP